jgi:hypothetical protein
VACPDKSKASPEEIEADMDTFAERSRKMEATDLEANPEAAEVVVERQVLCKRLVVQHHHWAKKGMDALELQQWNKGPRRKRGDLTEVVEDIRQDSQVDHWTGSRKGNRHICCRTCTPSKCDLYVEFF